MNIEKEIKKRAEKITISERKFFESSSLIKRLTRTASILTSKDISVLITGKVSTARTNGNRIQINPFCDLITSFSSRKLRFKAMMGMFYHECAHILYHDFDADEKALESIKNGTLYGGIPVAKTDEDKENLDALQRALLDPAYSTIIQRLYHDITNMFIDNHDENAIIKDYGAEVQYPILMLRRRLFADTPFYYVYEEGLQKMTALIFSMARFGKIHGDKALMKKDPDVQKLLSHQVAIQVGASTDSPYVRYSVINELVLLLWPYIKEKAENSSGSDMEDMSEEEKEKLAEEILETLNDLLDEMNSSDSSPSGETSPETAEKTKEADRKGKASLKKAGVMPAKKPSKRKSKPAKSEPEDSSEPPEETESAEDKEPESDRDTAEGTDDSSETTAEDSTSGEGSSESGETESTDTGMDGSSSSAFDGLSTSGEPMIGDDGEYAEDGEDSSEASDSMFDDVLDELKREAAERELETEQSDKIRAEAEETLRDSAWHKDISLIINRNLEVTDAMRDTYDEVMDADTKKTVQQLVKRIGAAIKETTEEEERRGLPYGSLIIAEEAYRRDKKFFGDRREPGDEPDIALAVLVDESGSMRGAQYDCETKTSITRWEAARKAAIVLYEFATGLNIPVCVTGHTTSSIDTVNYDVFSDFDSISGLDRYRLMNIHKYYENRDGCAIEIAAAHLSKRPEQIKVLVVISDGDPSHTDAIKQYYGSGAEEDVKNIVKKWRKKGMEVICFAIGDSKTRLENMYGTSAFVDIRNLNTLPKTMTKLLKKRIEKEI